MVRKGLILGAVAAFGLAGAAIGQVTFTPVNLAPSSFNEDVVIENTATKPLVSSVTATMDNGEGKAPAAPNGDTWFESGLSIAKPNTGFPVGAGTVVSAADPNTTFLLQPYSGKNVLLLNNHTVASGIATTKTGTFTLTTPTAAGALKFFGSSGNGAGTVTALVHYNDGAPDTSLNLTFPDWFDSNPPKNQAAIVSNGRVNPTNNTGAGSFDNFGQVPPNPRVYEITAVTLANKTDPISSIDFTFTKAAGDTNTAIFGLSTSTAPEPASLGLLGLGCLALLRRRHA